MLHVLRHILQDLRRRKEEGGDRCNGDAPAFKKNAINGLAYISISFPSPFGILTVIFINFI